MTYGLLVSLGFSWNSIQPYLGIRYKKTKVR